MSGRTGRVHFNLYLSLNQHSGLSEMASSTGLTLAALVRRGVELLLAARVLECSGMVVKGFRAETTSGTVWLGKGI